MSRARVRSRVKVGESFRAVSIRSSGNGGWPGHMQIIERPRHYTGKSPSVLSMWFIVSFSFISTWYCFP